MIFLAFLLLALTPPCFTETTSPIASTTPTTDSPTVTVAPELPFFLFASDFVTEIKLNESTCVFVQTHGNFDVSSIVFTPKEANGSLGTGVHVSSFITKQHSGFDVLFGRWCFDSETLIVDYGNAFDHVNDQSAYWQSALFFFMSEAKVEGVCKHQGPLDGNVHSFNSNGEALSVHSDCPAVVLGSAGVITEGVTDVSPCPLLALELYDQQYNSHYPIMPRNLRLNLSHVAHGLREDEDVSLMSLTHDNTLAYVAEAFMMSALIIRSNRSTWFERVLPVFGNGQEVTDSFYYVGRSIDIRSPRGYDGLVATYPYSPFKISYEMSFDDSEFILYNATLNATIDPSYFACATFSVKWMDSAELNWKNSTIDPSTGVIRIFAPSLTGLIIKIERKDTVACRNAFMKVPYTIRSNSTLATTSLAPTTSTSTTQSTRTSTVTRGMTTAPQPIHLSSNLPFFLFASDRVTEISLNESTCVFVQTAAVFNVTDIVFTPKNADGTLGEGVHANEFLVEMIFGITVLFGKRCFDTPTLLVDYGSTFDEIDENSVFWRSTVFYLMSKEKAEGDCANQGFFGGNVHSLHFQFLSETVSVHADCPAVILASTGSQALILPGSPCPLIGIYAPQNFSIPQNVRLDLSNVRSGLEDESTDLSLITLTHENAINYISEAFLSSALMITSNRSVWSENVLPIGGFNTPQESQVCSVDRSIDKNTERGFDGLIVTYPYGPLKLQYIAAGESFTVPNPEVQMQFKLSYFACAKFTLQWENGYFKWFNVTLDESSGVVHFGDPSFSGFMVNIERKNTVECRGALMKIPYTIRGTPKGGQSTVQTSSAAPVTTVIPTTSRPVTTTTVESTSTSPTTTVLTSTLSRTASTTVTPTTSQSTVIPATSTAVPQVTTSSTVITASPTSLPVITPTTVKLTPALPTTTTVTFNPVTSIPIQSTTVKPTSATAAPTTTVIPASSTSLPMTSPTTSTVPANVVNRTTTTVTCVPTIPIPTTTSTIYSTSSSTVAKTPSLSTTTAATTVSLTTIAPATETPTTTTVSTTQTTTVTSPVIETTTPKGGNPSKGSLLSQLLCAFFVVLVART